MMNTVLRDVKRKRDRSRSVIKIAILSRLLVIFISVLSNAATGEYDTSSQILLKNDKTAGGIYNFFLFFLRTFAKWDAIHFLNIAHRGYYYEQQFAFFPGLPIIVKGFSYLLYPFTYNLNEFPRLVLSGIILSNISFVLAAWALYKVTSDLCEEKFAWTTCLMFTFTPTPGFLSSIYTEPFFAMFTFSGIYFYHKKKFWVSAVLWMAASSFRSNGMLLAGYFIYDAVFVFQWPLNTMKRRVVKVISTVIQVLLILVPFFTFQMYAYHKLCVGYSPDEQSSWCKDRVPLIYPYVQLRYWNCGFLKFLRFSETPSFLLASPFFILSASGVYFYARSNWTRFLSVGLVKTNDHELEVTTTISPKTGSSSQPVLNNFLHKDLLPHIYLWLVLTVYSFTSMHVQVILRFFTSVPALYWFCAHVVLSKNIASHILIYYWVIYGLISITLFAGFFPPA